ncbi:MAG: ribonucleotide-diphosphate reductase subunit alpha, partial [Micrococcaceae bacterium]|nr:ribonucleotide-diphosphate reductase subunit alpha [Micrococcaceae bacterium]
MTTDIMEPTTDGIGARKDYHALNAQLNLFAADGSIQLGKDHEAVEAYLAGHVEPRMIRFDDLEAKIDYLIANEYYEEAPIRAYPWAFVKELYRSAYAHGYRFSTFLGAFKFHAGYSLKTFDGDHYLETFEDRVVSTALFLGRGDEELAGRLVQEMLSGRFQPATP